MNGRVDLAAAVNLVRSVNKIGQAQAAADQRVLKALGFRRGQTYATVCVQATTIAVVGVVIGLALGVALGAVFWRAAAARVGVVGDVAYPVPALVLVALCTIVVANLIAAIPARTAARTPVDVTLRAD